MKTPRFYFILLMSCLSHCVSGQEIIKTHRDGLYEYYHEDLYYSYKELRGLMQTNDEALKMHIKAKRAKVTSNILYATSATSALAFFLIAINPNCVDLCPPVVFFGGLILVSAPILLADIGARISYRVRKKKSVQLFNDGLKDMGLIDKLENNSVLKMHIGQTPNGLGVLMEF